MEEKKKALILGASGFIGSAILKTLLQEGYRVIAVQHHRTIDLQHPNLYIVNTSISNLDFDTLPFVPNVIVHAARNRTGRFGKTGRLLKSLQGYFENKTLLKKIAQLPETCKMYYCSGSLMYGSHRDKKIDETFPLNPVSFAKQYYIAELPALNAIREKKPVTMLRLPWVIGNGSWFALYYTKYMREKEAVPVYGEGENKMCFIDVDAIGAAIIEIEKTNFTGLLNLFHPHICTQAEWAAMLSKVSGLSVQKLSGTELITLNAAAKEAFQTNIAFTSVHRNIQDKLAHLHLPLPQIIQKHLSVLQNH